MIEEVPLIQVAAFSRPDPARVAQRRGAPTGFVCDAMGGTGAFDHRLRPAAREQLAMCGVALACHAGPADSLALIHAHPRASTRWTASRRAT